MRDLLEEMLRKLDGLHLILYESQEAQQSQEAVRLLHDTRTKAAAQAMALFRVAYFVNNFARVYLELLITMSLPPENSEARRNAAWASYLRIKADITARECEKAQKDMARFGQDTAGAVERATSLLSSLEPSKFRFKCNSPSMVNLITQTKTREETCSARTMLKLSLTFFMRSTNVPLCSETPENITEIWNKT